MDDRLGGRVLGTCGKMINRMMMRWILMSLSKRIPCHVYTTRPPLSDYRTRSACLENHSQTIDQHQNLSQIMLLLRHLPLTPLSQRKPQLHPPRTLFKNLPNANRPRENHS